MAMEPTYKTKTVHEAWTIASNLAEWYQKLAKEAQTERERNEFLIRRTIASEIAMLIKYRGVTS